MTCTGNCNQGRNCTCLTGAAYLADALDYQMADDDQPAARAATAA